MLTLTLGVNGTSPSIGMTTWLVSLAQIQNCLSRGWGQNPSSKPTVFPQNTKLREKKNKQNRIGFWGWACHVLLLCPLWFSSHIGSSAAELEILACADPGFLVRGALWSFDPKGGGLSLKFSPNRGFPWKLPENYMILKKCWGQGGPGPKGPPGSASALTQGALTIVDPEAALPSTILKTVLTRGSHQPHLFLAALRCEHKVKETNVCNQLEVNSPLTFSSIYQFRWLCDVFRAEHQAMLQGSWALACVYVCLCAL